MDLEEKKRIAVGVIGTGGMGTRHAVNLHRLVDGAFTAAVYDLDPAHAEKASGLCDGAEIFSDPYLLIANPKVDALLIASPDDTHADLTLAALHAGKSVLCEKPLATNLDAAKKVVQAEAALGLRLVSVGFMRRFDPQHAAVKAVVAGGELGKPLLWKGVHRNAGAAYGTSGATILTNSAGHDIDSARFLLGQEVLSVNVQGIKSRPELHEDTRDLMIVKMTMSDNCLAVGEVYVNADYGYEVSAEVVCQLGTAITTQPDRVKLRHKSHRGFYVSADWLAPFEEAYVIEDREWIESLQQNRLFSGASAWDGYVTMAVTTACIQSLHKGGDVAVNLMPKAAIY